jgi:hypothetical protein
MFAISAGFAFLGQIEESVRRSSEWGVTHPGGEARYDLSAAFFYRAGIASFLFMLLILATFRSPFRVWICVLLGVWQVIAISYAVQSLEQQQTHWHFRHDQGADHWAAHASGLASLVFHQLAFVLVWLFTIGAAPSEAERPC